MARFVLPYELSLEADTDLEDIFDYTSGRFGFDQAIIYVSSFDEVFNNLSVNPQIGRTRTEILPGLRNMVKESHVVFYRTLSDKVRIVRVLHASRDVIRFLPPTI